MQKFIIPLLIIIAIGLGIYLYSDYNSAVKEKIAVEKERLAEEKDRKERLEQEISGLQSQIADSKSTIQELNEKVNSLNASAEELKTSNNKVQSRLNSYTYQLKKERSKISDSKNKILSLVNERLANLLDHRIRKISIFNDDSSFAFYTGRRNYISLDAQNNLKMERTVHFTSTGQYLQAIYQDKDNGNNRFINKQYVVPLDKLDFKSAEIADMSDKEKLAFEKDFREETYVTINIPLEKDKSSMEMVETVEYNDQSFNKTTKVKNMQIYTSSIEEAVEVLALLKVLDSLT